MDVVCTLNGYAQHTDPKQVEHLSNQRAGDPSPEQENTGTGWRQQIRQQAHRIIHHLDDARDLSLQRLFDRFEWQQPASIQAYMGYRDINGLQLRGRVLANPALDSGPLDRDRWWRNLVDTYRRFASREVPGATVRLQLERQSHEVTTDQEGYYLIDSLPAPASGEYMESVPVKASHRGQCVSAIHRYICPQLDRQGGVAMISDIDDTILHTTSTRLLTAARLTFLHSARTRKPLDGVAALYREFHHKGLRPIFYVSSSPWNLHDLLVDFMHLNDIPAGPIQLRDWGVDADKLGASEGHGHKIDKIQALLDGYPNWQFVLVGDSGQEDGVIYSDIARANPGRIRAIYIRDVSPDHTGPRDAGIDELINAGTGNTVPLLKVGDSRAIADHLNEMGLLTSTEQSVVSADAAADEHRQPI